MSALAPLPCVVLTHLPFTQLSPGSLRCGFLGAVEPGAEPREGEREGAACTDATEGWCVPMERSHSLVGDWKMPSAASRGQGAPWPAVHLLSADALHAEPAFMPPSQLHLAAPVAGHVAEAQVFCRQHVQVQDAAQSSRTEEVGGRMTISGGCSLGIGSPRREEQAIMEQAIPEFRPLHAQTVCNCDTEAGGDGRGGAAARADRRSDFLDVCTQGALREDHEAEKGREAHRQLEGVNAVLLHQMQADSSRHEPLMSHDHLRHHQPQQLHFLLSHLPPANPQDTRTSGHAHASFPTHPDEPRHPHTSAPSHATLAATGPQSRNARAPPAVSWLTVDGSGACTQCNSAYVAFGAPCSAAASHSGGSSGSSISRSSSSSRSGSGSGGGQKEEGWQELFCASCLRGELNTRRLIPLANRCFECPRRAGWGDVAGVRASAARCKYHRLSTDVYVLRARCDFVQGCSRKPSFGVSFWRCLCLI
jgi:hypothetical protein